MLCLGDDNEMFNPYCFGNGDTVYRLLSGWLGECRNNFYAVLHSTMAGTVYMVVLSNTKKNGMCRMSLSLVKAFGI